MSFGDGAVLLQARTHLWHGGCEESGAPGLLPKRERTDHSPFPPFPSDRLSLAREEAAPAHAGAACILAGRERSSRWAKWRLSVATPSPPSLRSVLASGRGSATSPGRATTDRGPALDRGLDVAVRSSLGQDSLAEAPSLRLALRVVRVSLSDAGSCAFRERLVSGRGSPTVESGRRGTYCRLIAGSITSPGRLT